MSIIRIAICAFLIFIRNSILSQEYAVTPSGDTVLLFSDGTWKKRGIKSNDIFLKNRIAILAHKHSLTPKEEEEAFILASQGWRYTLPRPKSAKAEWGNYDGRTTWWYGGWTNEALDQYSSIKPKNRGSTILVGDGQNFLGMWRNGGSPATPSKVEVVLSEIKHSGN